MKSFATFTTVETDGRIEIGHVPFESGTEVEVLILPKRPSAESFRVEWEKVCYALRARSAADNLTDEEIQHEIDEHRTGR